MSNKKSGHIQNEIEKRASAWYLFLNELFGFVGFALGLG